MSTPSPSASERASRITCGLTFDSTDGWMLLRDRITSEITAAEQAARPQWMPIETAPVGIDVLYVWDDGSMNMTRSDPNVGFWYPEPPIAWMPLPEPPSKETV